MFNARRYRKKRTTKPRRKAVRKAMRNRGKFGNPRAMAPSANNYAKIVETINYETVNPNTMYGNLITLADTTRALAMAANFQWYRITAVEWKYKPLFNTFQDSISTTVSSPSKPEFYSIMNRNGNFPANTLLELKEQGAIARSFARNLNIKYKPNTLLLASIANTDGTTVANANELKFNAWLPCSQTVAISPSSDWTAIPYYGHQFYIDQEIPTQAANPEIASLEARVVIEFKGPQVVEGGPLAKTVVVKAK